VDECAFHSFALTPYVARQSPDRQRNRRLDFGVGAIRGECISASDGTVGAVACCISVSWSVPVWDVVVCNGGVMTPVFAGTCWTERGA
jgi:hypothetical protein